MKKTLMAHQKRAVSFLDSNSGGPLFMEMRLGKTLTAIRYVKNHLLFPCLVISPYQVINEWFNQLKDDEENHIISVIGTRQQRIELLNSDARWFLSNYESASKLQLHAIHHWKAVICDESVRIANPKAKITVYMLNNFKNVKCKIVLCGNPAPESELQLTTQFIFCYGNFMGYRNYWGLRAREYVSVGYEWRAKPEFKTRLLEYVKRKAFVLSRKDAGMGNKKIYAVRKVKMNEEQLKQIKGIKYDFEYGDKEVKMVLQQMVAYAYIAGGLSCEDGHKLINDAKIKELINLLKGELKGQKVLVWCKHRAEQIEIIKALKDEKILHIMINGDVTPEERAERKTNWETYDFVNVAVLTIRSASKGQNWSAADTAVYYSNEFSNDERSQSEDRIESVQKAVPLLIIDLVSEGSIDEDVLGALKEKSFDAKLIMETYARRIR